MQNKVIQKRLLSLIPTLLGVSLLLFLLLKLSPGDPVNIIVGPRATEEIVEKYREKLHLDKPFFVQYFYYMKTVAKGDLGRSYYTNERVFDSLMSKLPNTLILATLSMILGAFMGILLGVAASLKRGSFLDKLLSSRQRGVFSDELCLTDHLYSAACCSRYQANHGVRIAKFESVF